MERRILEIHQKHPDEAAKGLTERGEREILSWLAEAKETDSQMLEQMIQATAGLGDAQVSAILMDARHKRWGRSRGINRSPESELLSYSFQRELVPVSRFSGKYILMFLSALRRLSIT